MIYCFANTRIRIIDFTQASASKEQFGEFLGSVTRLGKTIIAVQDACSSKSVSLKKSGQRAMFHLLRTKGHEAIHPAEKVRKQLDEIYIYAFAFPLLTAPCITTP